MLHPAYEIVGDRHHERPLVVTCEHASNRLPEEIEASPEDRPWLETHWGWDPGAAAVTRALIEHKDCVAIMSRFSRLVCDPNRHVEEWDWIRERCEDYELSFNRHLSDEERQRRRATYHEPFHAEVDACLSERLARGGERLRVALAVPPRLRELLRTPRGLVLHAPQVAQHEVRSRLGSFRGFL